MQYTPVTEKIKKKVIALLAEKKSQKKISELLNISPRNVFLIKNDLTAYKNGKEVRATGVSEALYKELENISENLGHKKLSHFIKKELPAIRDKYPANFRVKKH